jgi:hypothetical protein
MTERLNTKGNAEDGTPAELLKSSQSAFGFAAENITKIVMQKLSIRK